LGLRGDRSNGNLKIGTVYFDGQNATVGFIAHYIEPRFQRVVVDQTGLMGGLDVHVTVPTDAERLADPSVPEREVAKELVTDFIDKPGLKMQARRVMVEILVVDHAEPLRGN
jgi:uncharacterized protein (TIGR03435 family)